MRTYAEQEPVRWVTCTSHAARFPEGWEEEHAAGPLALGNGPCELRPAE